jgi:hypothetical protein
MAAITDISDLINRATGGSSGTPESVFWQKVPRIAGAAATANIAGRPASLWRYDGVNFAGGAIPGAVAAPDRTTVGAMAFTNPGGARQKWLINAWTTGLVGGTLLIYDRLLHIGGLSATVTSHAVGGTLTRYTDGEGNFAFAEIYTIIGSSGSTIRLSDYDNSVPTGSRVGPYVVIGGTGFREVTRAIMLPLQSGDTGISDITSIELSGTTGTAGSFGVTIGHPIAYLGVGAPGACGWRDFTTGMPGIPEVEPDACLSLLWIPQTTTAPDLTGGLSYVEA